MALSKKSFELHVSLLQETRALKVADARFTAWMEGPKGLDALLGNIPALPASKDATK